MLRKLNLLPVNQIARRLTTTAKVCSDDLFVHRDSADNNAQTPFEFTEANMKRIEALLKNYPASYPRSVVSFALDIVQRQIGWVPIAAMNKVADMLSMPRMRVYEWATFYTMNKRQYRGKFHIKVCVTTPCMIMGSDVILRAAELAACTKLGELSKDGLFGIDEVQCQGACVNAPVVVINDDYYEDLSIYDIQKIIACLKNGGIPPPGPQSGRYCCEPHGQLTSLLSPPTGPGFKLQGPLGGCSAPKPCPPPEVCTPAPASCEATGINMPLKTCPSTPRKPICPSAPCLPQPCTPGAPSCPPGFPGESGDKKD